MAITKEVLDELLKDYNSPDEFYGPNVTVKTSSDSPFEIETSRLKIRI